jgi:hypothetical protein
MLLVLDGMFTLNIVILQSKYKLSVRNSSGL